MAERPITGQGIAKPRGQPQKYRRRRVLPAILKHVARQPPLHHHLFFSPFPENPRAKSPGRQTPRLIHNSSCRANSDSVAHRAASFTFAQGVQPSSSGVARAIRVPVARASVPRTTSSRYPTPGTASRTFPFRHAATARRNGIPARRTRRHFLDAAPAIRAQVARVLQTDWSQLS